MGRDFVVIIKVDDGAYIIVYEVEAESKIEAMEKALDCFKEDWRASASEDFKFEVHAVDAKL